MLVIARLTQAQAAAIINAVSTIIQYTFGLAVVVLLVYFMPNMNPAIVWSGVTRTLHSSIWPLLLRTDSTSSGVRWSRIYIFSNLGILGGVLIAIAGIVTPLGLEDGPLVRTESVSMGASYIADVSPIGRATSPRGKSSYSRICGADEPVPCPGNGLNGNTSQIAPYIFDTFSSTPYGPFNMQFRHYYQGVGGYNYPMTTAKLGTLESLILRNDVFAIEGLIVDLTKKPGIGLWNHTLPTLQRGGVWSEDVLWIEPVSACVDTNLTIDYREKDNDIMDYVGDYNLTDRGGFVGLTRDYPRFSLDGQDINLYEHAYKAAVLSNRCTMRSFNNMTRNESYVGNTFPSNSSAHKWPGVGRMKSMSLSAFLDPNATVDTDPELYDLIGHLNTLCRGYGGGDIANITNVSVDCSLMAGPPYRVDGGDPRLPGDNTTWRQTLHVCAAATRARMQRVEFSFNGTSTVDSLRISRQDTNTSVLWAIEKTNLTIANVGVFWGHVADSYETDPSLSTTRSEVFYLPATIWDIPSAGNPSTVPAAVWGRVFSDLIPGPFDGPDYSASNNYALLVKWQSLIVADPKNSPAQILNMIWTDKAANSLVGTNTATTLTVAPYVPSVAYDWRYGIPALLLLCIWLPLFLTATFILLFNRLKISHLRYRLNHTSIGRVVTGDSPMRATSLDADNDAVGSRQSPPFPPRETGDTAASHPDTKAWTKGRGQTPVAIFLGAPIPESKSNDSLTQRANEADDQSATLMQSSGDLLQKGKPLRAALEECVQSVPSHNDTHTEPPMPSSAV